MVKVVVNGCNGKMGRIISELVDKNENMILKGGIDIEDFGILKYPVYTDAFKMPEKPDVIIDFSVPKATFKILEYAKEKNVPIVIATTGFNIEEEEKIKEY